MKKLKLLLLTGFLVLSTCFPAFAGTWTHTHDTEWGTNTYDYLWFYVKDNGEYAQSEWVQDSDGTWYWIDDNQYLPTSQGVADDGGLYNSKGAYIDFSDGSRKYLTKELSSQIANSMTYEQVISILGKEHEVDSSSQSITSYGTYDYLTLKWYSKDAKGSQYVAFTNGIVSYASSYWQ